VTGLRPDPTPNLRQIIVTKTMARSWYTGLQLGIRTRALHRQTYSVAYTLASSRNNTDGAKAFPTDQRNLMADAGPSASDARHNLVATGTWATNKWTFASVVIARSGLPYNITTGKDDNLDGNTNDRPDGVTRNSARGAAYLDVDARVGRTLHIAGCSTEILFEVFNLTNHPNWNGYQGNKSSPAFGTHSGAGPPRQLQLGVRISF